MNIYPHYKIPDHDCIDYITYEAKIFTDSTRNHGSWFVIVIVSWPYEVEKLQCILY